MFCLPLEDSLVKHCNKLADREPLSIDSHQRLNAASPARKSQWLRKRHAIQQLRFVVAYVADVASDLHTSIRQAYGFINSAVRSDWPRPVEGPGLGASRVLKRPGLSVFRVKGGHQATPAECRLLTHVGHSAENARSTKLVLMTLSEGVRLRAEGSTR
jgi:hypothetical protein